MDRRQCQLDQVRHGGKVGRGGKRTDIVTAMLRGRFVVVVMIRRAVGIAVMHRHAVHRHVDTDMLH